MPPTLLVPSRVFAPVLSSLAVAATASGQTITFLPRVDFGTAQENAQQCVVADFDHDGHLDLAITMEGYNQGKLEVLYGDGQSDFGTSREFINYVAWGLGSGDFDGDGWLDLAVTSYGWAQHGVHAWRNNHDRTFVNSGTVSTLATPPVAVVSGDFDSDGIVDLAAASEGGGYAVDWFHGNGNGTFGSFQVVPNTTGLVGRDLHAGHFDAGGSLDLVLIHQGGVMVLLNDPLGTGYINAVASGIPAEPMTCAAVVDLDGDGLDDLVTAGNTIKVWHCSGGGAFQIWGSYAGASLNDLVVGDVSGDGVPDLLAVGYGGVQILPGIAVGGFDAPQSVPTGFYPVAGAIGDWNEDGWNDIAVVCKNLAGNSSHASIYEQVPPGIAATATPFGSGCGSPALDLAPVASARPLIGRTGRANLGNVPSPFAAVAMGFSDQSAGGQALPASLAALGMPGCDLLQSAELMGFATTPSGANTMAFALALPNRTTLVGFDVHLQAYALAPGQNAMQAIVSNGLHWHIGNQ